jgi:hypothetical protein
MKERKNSSVNPAFLRITTGENAIRPALPTVDRVQWALTSFKAFIALITNYQAITAVGKHDSLIRTDS